MTKKYFNIVFRFAREWFQLPKVLLTALLILSFYKLQFFPKAYFIFIAILFCVVVLELLLIFKNTKQAKKEFKKTGKKWLFKSIININGVGNATFLFSYIIHFFLPENPNEMLEASLSTKLITAFLTTFFIIFGYILLVVIPKKSEELLQETYPEYKMINNL